MSYLEEGYTRAQAYSQVGHGWHGLMAPVFDAMEAAPDPEFRIETVKEKFGTLRLDPNITNHPYAELAQQAAALSGHVCEKCGHLGDIGIGGWMKTLCPRHFPDFFNPSIVPAANMYTASPFGFLLTDKAAALTAEERFAILATGASKDWLQVVASPVTTSSVLEAYWTRLSGPASASSSIDGHYLDTIMTAFAVNPNTPEDVLLSLAQQEGPQILYCLARRTDLSPEVVAILLTKLDVSQLSLLAQNIPATFIAPLLNHPARLVRRSLAANPYLTGSQIMRLAKEPFYEISDTVLRRPDCPQSLLLETYQRDQSTGPDIVLNPNAPATLLETIMVQTDPALPYSSQMAQNIVPRLIDAMKTLAWRPSKPCLAWLMNHPDRQVRLSAGTLMSPARLP